MCVCARGVHVHICACEGLKTTLGTLPQASLTLVLETGSLTEPGIHQFRYTGWPASLQGPSVSTSPVLALQAGAITLSSLHGLWEFELSPYKCMASTFPTEPSPSPAASGLFSLKWKQSCTFNLGLLWGSWEMLRRCTRQSSSTHDLRCKSHRCCHQHPRSLAMVPSPSSS